MLKQIVYLVLLIASISYASASNMTVQQLIDSYNYSYSDGTLDVTSQTDYMIDKNSNGVNDTLIVNITTNAATAGTYKFVIEITNGNSILVNETTKSITASDVWADINFPSELLYNPKFNYSIRIQNSNDDLVFRKNSIESQNYLSYDTGLNITSITDNNIANNLIRLNLTVDSPQATTENVTVTLAYNSSTISKTQERTLNSGIQNISIDFDNETIKSTHYIGNFTIDAIVIGNKIFDFNRNTSVYNYEEFAKTSYIKSIADGRIDSNNNNLLEFLEINFTIDVKTAENYAISYDLYDQFGSFMINISKNQTLAVGTRNITTLINGSEIYKAKIDGPYVLSFAKLHVGNETKDIIFDAHTTNQSFYTDYERPPLPDLNLSMEVMVNSTTNITNITITLTNIGEAPAFNVFMDIFDNTTYENNRSLAFMDAGESTTYKFNITNSSNTTLYTAIADFDNLVDENNESNNIAQNTETEVALLAIESLTMLNDSGTLKTYEFIILNNASTTITDIQWQFDTRDNYVVNSTVNISSLLSNEKAFVYVQYNFSIDGNFSVKANATGLSQSGAVTASLTVSTAPTISAIPDITFDEDLYNDTLNLSNYGSDAEDMDSALSWTVSNNANTTVTISQTTKIANFTALANWSGSENIKFTVTDTSGLTDNDTILVTVSPVNDPPSFNSSNPILNLKWPEDTINESINLTGHFYDIDSINLNFTASNTGNVSIYIQNITGKVNITPNANWSGTAYAVFTVIDSEGLTASSNNITLNITPVNDAPTFTGTIPQWKWQEDTINSSLSLTQYFSDIDGDILKYNYTSLTNITISINNNTGIVTLTPNGNFTGIRNTTFYAIDVANLTIPSNTVILNITPVNDPPSIDSFEPSELKQTIVAGSSLTFNHTSSDIDGDLLTYTWKLDLTEKSAEQGWKYTPILSELGEHNVTLNVSDGIINTSMQWNITIINQSSIDVYGLEALSRNSTLIIFGFSINNTGETTTSGINWSLDTGQAVISANNLISLQPNKSAFIFTGYNYTATGEFTATASATNKSHSDSESITIDIPDIELSNLSIFDENLTKRIFEITIENTLPINLTSVNWTFDTKNSTIINSTSNIILQPNEKIFAYIGYNFTGIGTFNVNATARNGTLTDSKNLTITIT